MTSSPLQLQAALHRSKNLMWAAAMISCAVNILMLTGPIFMLQVYDRVLLSRSVPTLIALFGLVVLLYGFMGVFEFARTRILSRMGYGLERDLMQPAQKLWVLQGVWPGKTQFKPAQELGVLRSFAGSSGLPALFDLPWVPIYLALVFALHVWLGVLAALGLLGIVALTYVNDRLTQKGLQQATGFEFQESGFADVAQRNAHSILSMGMMGAVLRRSEAYRGASLTEAQQAAEISETITAASKAFRLLLQSAILALGAYLAIFQEITPGAMIAASILAGRALAPIDQSVANWRSFIRARLALSRLKTVAKGLEPPAKQLDLPAPKGALSVKIAGLRAPHSTQTDAKPILQGVQFQLAPGDGLGVIGPSGAGKSSLAKLLTGIWATDQGEVRLDGALLQQWDMDKLGQHMGYLPQSVELLPGTLAENISRFEDSAKDEDIITAAKMAGVHELILSFKKGYASRVASDDIVLSGGQVQRIALARALYKAPHVLVLDEPNSNLDADGEEALTRAILALRQQGSIVVVMAHRPSAIAAVNKVLMLVGGRQMEFGDKEEVLRKVTRPVAVPRPAE